MSSVIPEGRYAMVIVSEIGDRKVTTAFAHMADYYDYLNMQRKQHGINFDNFTNKEELN